jgi:hypothetical protein
LSEEIKAAAHYRATLQMFRRATHAAWKAQTSFRVILILVALLFAAAAFTVGIGASVADQMPVAIYLLLGSLFYFWYPSHMFARDPKNREDVHYEFSRDGVSYSWAGAKWSMPWSFLNQARETREFYVLELPNHLRLAIPKSGFAPGAEQHFRLLAATGGVPIRH